jgi:urease alpha subunit
VGNELGSIERGKATDAVVLHRNLFEIDPDSIIDTEVVHTIFAGEIVYDATDVAKRVPSIVKPAARSSPDSESLVMGAIVAAGLASGLARTPQLATERCRAGRWRNGNTAAASPSTPWYA